MKVLVAMSGGVDSAVAALLLKQQGHDVAAAYMRTWMDETGSGILADCPWEEDIRYARAVCSHLGIPFEIINLINQYREKVVQYLVDGYRRGITPNPDIMCNREMKFGVFRQIALERGYDAIATGHYCRLIRDDHRIHLLQGADPNKDQSYFLAMVRKEQLTHVLFPTGEYKKADVRRMAKEAGLPNAERKDSQGICFLGKVDIRAFLAQYIEDTPGEIVRADNGKVLGTHKGLHRFTLGQRRGIGIPSNTDFKNYVVVGKDYTTNRLIVAFDEPQAPGLYQKSVALHGFNWIESAPSESCTLRLLAKPRYRDPSFPATLVLEPGKPAILHFDEEQRALASGQVVAFYDGETLLGGAFYA